MSVYELIVKRRTIRKFQQKKISEELLRKLVNAGRLAPSGANLQPLEFIVVHKKDLLNCVFSTLQWAGDPPIDKQPTAYIIVLINTEIRKEKGNVDAAAAIENMILAAWNKEVGSCWIGSINRDEVRNIFDIPLNYEIDSVLALGYPDESPVIEDAENSIKYRKDKNGTLHVPKRKLNDIIHFNRF